MKNNELTIQQIIDAKMAIINGRAIKDIAKDMEVSAKFLKTTLSRIDGIYASNLPALKADQEIIKATIMDKLEPLRDELSDKSVQITRIADNRLIKVLEDPKSRIFAKDLATISDTHSKRFERLTGIDKDKDAGDRGPAEMSPRIVQIFNRFLSKDDIQEVLDENAKKSKTVDAEIVE